MSPRKAYTLPKARTYISLSYVLIKSFVDILKAFFIYSIDLPPAITNDYQKSNQKSEQNSRQPTPYATTPKASYQQTGNTKYKP